MLSRTSTSSSSVCLIGVAILLVCMALPHQFQAHAMMGFGSFSSWKNGGGGNPLTDSRKKNEKKTADDDDDKDDDDNHDDNINDYLTVVSSSLVYDQGCFVSASDMTTTILCNHHPFISTKTLSDRNEETAFLVANSMLFQPSCVVDVDVWSKSECDDNNYNDDDNDNDDDDGHSSMLSNASLKKSKRLSVQPLDRTRDISDNAAKPTSRIITTTFEKVFSTTTSAFMKPTASPSMTVLSMRGGANGKPNSASQSSTKAAQKAASKTQATLPQRSNHMNTSIKAVSTKKTSTTTASKKATASASRMGSEALKRLLVTALVTLLYEGAIGHILEFLKIVLQTASDDLTYTQAIQQITAEKGLLGLWDGFCPWGMIQAICKGAVFGLAYSLALSLLLDPLAHRGWISSTTAQTLAGGIGGGLQGLVLSPTLLLKTRVMTNPVFREPMSLGQTTWLSIRIGWDVIQTEGLLTLMKGSRIFATKRVFDWGSRYLFSDSIEHWLVKLKGHKPLTNAEKSIASLLGGVASTCVTLPLDVLVAKTQDAKQAGVNVSPVKLFLDELAESGWNGLRHNYMRGFEARLAHVCTTTAGTYDITFCGGRDAEKRLKGRVHYVSTGT